MLFHTPHLAPPGVTPSPRVTTGLMTRIRCIGMGTGARNEIIEMGLGTCMRTCKSSKAYMGRMGREPGWEP